MFYWELLTHLSSILGGGGFLRVTSGSGIWNGEVELRTVVAGNSYLRYQGSVGGRQETNGQDWQQV